MRKVHHQASNEPREDRGVCQDCAILARRPHSRIRGARANGSKAGKRDSRGTGAGRALFLLLLLVALSITAEAVEPGFELVKNCRANLNMLNEATAKYLKDGNGNLPTWDRLKDVYTMCLTTKYLPKMPVPPTPDCAYFLVNKGPENFDWYCDLHGLIGGDKTFTFRYHEFQVQARVNTKYLTIPKYQNHSDNLLRWCGYVPTLMEDIRYHYARNPFSTVVIVVIGLLVCWFVYRNVFGP